MYTIQSCISSTQYWESFFYLIQTLLSNVLDSPKLFFKKKINLCLVKSIIWLNYMPVLYDCHRFMIHLLGNLRQKLCICGLMTWQSSNDLPITDRNNYLLFVSGHSIDRNSEFGEVYQYHFQGLLGPCFRLFNTDLENLPEKDICRIGSGARAYKAGAYKAGAYEANSRPGNTGPERGRLIAGLLQQTGSIETVQKMETKRKKKSEEEAEQRAMTMKKSVFIAF